MSYIWKRRTKVRNHTKTQRMPMGLGCQCVVCGKLIPLGHRVFRSIQRNIEVFCSGCADLTIQVIEVKRGANT